jgi:GNAT superfamily N-acetyltransferase
MRAEACAEGYQHLERLAVDWTSRAVRFDGEGEALLAVQVDGSLAGIGGLTSEAAVPGAFRMRRFYVRPPFRRQGIGGKLALVLIERAFRIGRFVTVNAGNVDGAAFWETLALRQTCGTGTRTLFIIRVHRSGMGPPSGLDLDASHPIAATMALVRVRPIW